KSFTILDSLLTTAKQKTASKRRVTELHKPKKSSRGGSTVPDTSSKNAAGPVNGVLLGRLKTLRMEIARESRKPPFMIFSDATLSDMCARMPKNEAEMLEVNGVGPVKMAAFGGQFLRECVSFQG
ncbi:MAG: hypothetical protein E4H36_14450, partial [Spirochaetales bacterium]